MAATFEEFARRLCRANHRRDFDNASPADRRVPCGPHLHEARSFWGLTQPAGAKSLAVILDVASEPYAERIKTDTITPQVENLTWRGFDDGSMAELIAEGEIEAPPLL